MKRSSLILLGFVVMALLQCAAPGLMVFHQEDVRLNGREFHFRTAPVDPYDPFRGKYVFLTYQDDEILLAPDDTIGYDYDENVYAHIEEDSLGFAIVKAISRAAPSGTTDYVAVSVDHIFQPDTKAGQMVNLRFPFDTFYMEESKAYPAEQIYWDSRRNDSLPTYSVVRIKNGAFSLVDVIVDEVPLRERVLMEQEKEE